MVAKKRIAAKTLKVVTNEELERVTGGGSKKAIDYGDICTGLFAAGGITMVVSATANDYTVVFAFDK